MGLCSKHGCQGEEGALTTTALGSVRGRGWTKELLVCTAQSQAVTGSDGGPWGPLFTGSLLNADGGLVWRLSCHAPGSRQWSQCWPGWERPAAPSRMQPSPDAGGLPCSAGACVTAQLPQLFQILPVPPRLPNIEVINAARRLLFTQLVVEPRRTPRCLRAKMMQTANGTPRRKAQPPPRRAGALQLSPLLSAIHG